MAKSQVARCGTQGLVVGGGGRRRRSILRSAQLPELVETTQDADLVLRFVDRQ